MKKMFLLIAMICCGIAAQADVIATVTVEVGIGRAKKDCRGIWLCVRITDIDVALKQAAMMTSGHGLVLHDNGGLSIAVDMNLLRKQDPAKYQELRNATSIELDEDETLPAELTRQVGYTGSNTFAAGTYAVEKYNENYILIHIR